MNTVLLDTSVVSLLHPKKKENPIRALYDPHMKGNILTHDNDMVGLDIPHLNVISFVKSNQD